MDLLTEYRLKYCRRLASLNLDICLSTKCTTKTDIPWNVQQYMA